MVTTSYPLEERGPSASPGRINYNFSPSLALIGEHLILSSTSSFAEELSELVESGGRSEPPAHAPATDSGSQCTNSAIGIDLATLKQVLEDNRQHLVAQNILQKGHDQPAAEREIGTLLELAGMLRDLQLSLVWRDRQVQLDAALHLRP